MFLRFLCDLQVLDVLNECIQTKDVFLYVRIADAMHNMDLSVPHYAWDERGDSTPVEAWTLEDVRAAVPR